jgi:hypothetical protein
MRQIILAPRRQAHKGLTHPFFIFNTWRLYAFAGDIPAFGYGFAALRLFVVKSLT